MYNQCSAVDTTERDRLSATMESWTEMDVGRASWKSLYLKTVRGSYLLLRKEIIVGCNEQR